MIVARAIVYAALIPFLTALLAHVGILPGLAQYVPAYLGIVVGQLAMAGGWALAVVWYRMTG